MFVFVVPFKSRASCADWRTASLLCANSVASMLANPESDIRVVLSCSEVPEGLPSDPRLIVQSVSLPTPLTQYEKMSDKYFKAKAALAVARDFAPAWIMGADADDLVSNRLVSFIEAQKPTEFWFSQFGWRYSPGSNFAIKISDFYRFCGTSSVTYARKESLPVSIDDPMRPDLIDTPHPEIIIRRLDMGLTPRPIPFPTTIYVVNSGENHSGNWSPKQHDRRTRLRLALNTRLVMPGMRREFGLMPSALTEAEQRRPERPEGFLDP